MEQNSELDESIKQYLFTNPLVLLAVNDPVILTTASKYLYTSVGFEIECSPKEGIIITKDIIQEFESIPYILDADVDGYSEIRFRIPTGAKGFLCLYYITIKLKKYFALNLGSGIHYHVNVYGADNVSLIRNSVQKLSWALDELDSWEYKGTYNNRVIGRKGDWIALRSNTIEIRIGEMTFDYELLIKRITHAISIVSRMLVQSGGILPVPPASDNEIDVELNLSFLKYKDNSLINKLSSINERLEKLKEKYFDIEEAKLDEYYKYKTLQNRIIKV